LINATGNKREILPGETSMLMDMSVISKEGIHYTIAPQIAIQTSSNTLRNIPDTVLSQNLVVRFNTVKDEKKEY